MKVNPDGNNAQYLHEVQEGKQIFQKSFKEMQKSTFAAQKAEFGKAAQTSINAILDSSKALMNSELQKQTEQLKADFTAYQENPTAENAQKVSDDFNHLSE